MHTQLIDALRNPALYRQPVGEVELIETHISWVLLAGDLVYKIKKPLDLGFLDFSTLEKRAFFCREEVRLNRRTAPELYLDVVEIRGTPERPSLEGDGEIIEYAVKMRRFEPSAGFDRLLADGRLEHEHITDLGRSLAELHSIAKVAPPESRFGSIEDVADPMRDNFTDLARLLDNDAFGSRLRHLQQSTDRQLGQHFGLLEDRHRQGFTRECHGDAHLGNVALIDGRATLFDCIEFSEDLRWIDVMCDLAFTVMDLRDRGAPGLAWLLLDEYLAHTGDYEGLRLLPLYMVYRALVRAKVNAFRLEDDDVDRTAALAEIDGYLALAKEISLEHRPAVLVTMGVSGSGKSWLARGLVERAGVIRVRSDVERKRLHGLTPGADSGSGLETDLYSAEATRRTYQRLVELARAITDAGIPVLIDAACLKRWQRGLFESFAQQRGIPFSIIHCRADEDVLRARIVARDKAGDDPSEAGLDVLRHQHKTLEPLNAGERKSALVLDTAAPDSSERATAWINTLLGPESP